MAYEPGEVQSFYDQETGEIRDGVPRELQHGLLALLQKIEEIPGHAQLSRDAILRLSRQSLQEVGVNPIRDADVHSLAISARQIELGHFTDTNDLE